MNDQEKSILLAKARHWHVKEELLEGEPAGHVRWVLRDPIHGFFAVGPLVDWIPLDLKDGPHITNEAEAWDYLCPDFYLLANFHLAWDVLNWAWEKRGIKGQPRFVWEWVLRPLIDGDRPFKKMQHAFLDKIFDLCVEASIIELEAEDE